MPRLHVIAGDDELAAPGFRNSLAGLVGVGGGRLAVHLRARRMSAARLCEVAKGAVEVAGAGGTAIVVNDRLDVALAVGAAGVHLREDSMGPRDVRGVVGVTGDAATWARPMRPRDVGRVVEDGGREFLVGRSIHAPEQAPALADGGVDYLVLGSVYETASHPGGRPIGVGAVAAVAATVAVPVLAIGGVGLGEVPGLLARGAYGVVVKSGVWGADHAVRAVTRYLEVLEVGG